MTRLRRELKFNKILIVILLIATVAIAIFNIVVSSKRGLTPLEDSLMWLFGLATALIGSYLFARRYADKPHARSAFRRILRLYDSLSRLGKAISKAQKTNPNENNGILQVLQAIVTEQIATADDALEDWRDIIPKDVEEIERKLKGKKEKSDGGKG